MFLKVSTNNYVSTILSSFVSTINESGLPSLIRRDRGGEYSLGSQLMLEHPDRGPNRHGVIAGQSVHNQHIETLEGLILWLHLLLLDFFNSLKIYVYWIY